MPLGLIFLLSRIPEVPVSPLLFNPKVGCQSQNKLAHSNWNQTFIP